MKVSNFEYATKRHKDWLSMAHKLGAGDFAEDVVQEMYLKLLELKNPEKIMYNQTELNGFYIYIIIKNLVYDLKKAQTKYTMVSVDEVINLCDDSPEDEHEFMLKIETLNNETEKWYWYDKMLFNIYHSTGMSIRKLSQETNISASSIFNTLKVCKEKIIIAHKTKTNG